LTASDVNEFLMDQSVMVFAGTAARGSAIPSPSEGMVTYRSDDDLVEVYNGSSFVPVGGILQVVSTTTTTTTSTTSTSYVNTSLSASITPSSASSKILISFSVGSLESSHSFAFAKLAVFRGTVSDTNIADEISTTYMAQNFIIVATGGGVVLDSPSTTSSTAYTIGLKTTNASHTVKAEDFQSIVLMEVAG
jgi:hypothetical protein